MVRQTEKAGREAQWCTILREEQAWRGNYPKYELIASHISRRSGATNLYKLGALSNMDMRSITGHQSEKVFENYVRIGLSKQAQMVGDRIKAAMEARKRVDK